MYNVHGRICTRETLTQSICTREALAQSMIIACTQAHADCRRLPATIAVRFTGLSSSSVESIADSSSSINSTQAVQDASSKLELNMRTHRCNDPLVLIEAFTAASDCALAPPKLPGGHPNLSTAIQFPHQRQGVSLILHVDVYLATQIT